MPAFPYGRSLSELLVGAAYGMHEEAGLEGMFTRHQAPDALPNGTRIAKINSTPGDENPDGTLGEIIGSVGPVSYAGETMFGYFVRWDSMPNRVVFIAGKRVRATAGNP